MMLKHCRISSAKGRGRLDERQRSQDRLCQNSRHEGEASHVNRSGPDLYGGHYADQLGKSVLMGAPALRE
jgi:hypothetical protein